MPLENDESVRRREENLEEWRCRMQDAIERSLTAEQENAPDHLVRRLAFEARAAIQAYEDVRDFGRPLERAERRAMARRLA